MGVALAAVSLGEQGCAYATKDHAGRCQVPAEKTVDTTGAGDILWGIFLHGLIREGVDVRSLPPQRLDDLMLTACTAAAMSTEKGGAIPSIPDLSSVQDRLHHQKKR